MHPKPIPSSIEIASASHKNPHKNQNGDSCLFEYLETENLILFALADGVGSSPCDWKASQMSCVQFVAHFKKEKQNNTEERIIKAIHSSNQDLLLEPGKCEGMKSTLSIVVWDLSQEQIYYTSIGDSRIYEWTKSNKFNQLSNDEVRSVILKKRDGKPMVIAGTVVVAEGITNAMGSPSLTITVQSKSATDTYGIILSTDGFHGMFSNIDEALNNFMPAIDLQKAVDYFLNTRKDEQKDDMTILIGRLEVSTKKTEQIGIQILNQEDLSSYNHYDLAVAIYRGLNKNISAKNENNLNRLLNLVEEQNIDLGRIATANLISLMMKENFQSQPIYRELRRLLKNCKY